jgi:isopentenyl-diphosphate delta-isomerase
MSRLAVVDEADHVVGEADYDQVHFDGLLHRFVSVFVLSNNNQKGQERLLLQKRSNSKHHGSLLSESVSAHVLLGEQYHQTAQRRLVQELGLTSGNLREITKIRVNTYDEKWTNNAFVKIYEFITLQKPRINTDEIQDAFFLPLSKIRPIFDNNSELFVPGFIENFEAFLRCRTDIIDKMFEIPIPKT